MLRDQAEISGEGLGQALGIIPFLGRNELSKCTSLPQNVLEVDHDAESQKMVFVKLSFSFYLQGFLVFFLVAVRCAVSLKSNKFLSIVFLLELTQQIILREALYWAVTVQAGDALCFSSPFCVSGVPSVPFLHHF